MSTPFPFVWCRVGGADAADGAANVDGVVPVTARYARNAVLSAGIGDGNLGNTSGNPLLPNWIGHFWGPGAEIKVGFIGGSVWQWRQVQKFAPQWAEYGNFDITFPDEGAYDITVDFVPELANFSMIGAHSLWMSDRSVASMNLGSVQQSTPENIRRAVILQVFGLALGLTHTFPTKIANIPWDKAQVYKDLAKEPLGWSQKDVDDRAFVAENYAEAHYFGDDKSIMTYNFPSSWVKKSSSWMPWSGVNVTADWNLDFTQKDKELVKYYYPDLLFSKFDARHFQSMEIRHWNAPAATTVKQEKLLEPWAQSHKFLAGLTLFDLDNEYNFRLRASVSTDKEWLTAKMYSRGDSINYLSGMTYLELKQHQWTFQSGIFNTIDIHPADKPQLKNSKRIDFAQEFSFGAPKVICWLSGIDQDKSGYIRAKAYPTKVDSKGFTINLDAWGDSVFYQGEAGWLAVPSYQVGFTVGTVETPPKPPAIAPGPDTSGTEKFSLQVPFFNPPKMFFALNKIEMGNEGTWCCRSALEDVTKEGFKWNFQSWWTTALHSAGASYFAWNA